MTNVTLNKIAIQTVGDLPKKNELTPNFLLTTNKLNEVTPESYSGKIKVLNIFPSLDTSTCALTVKRFYKETCKMPNVVVLNISKDLPFAQARFCSHEKLKNVETLSAFRSNFGLDYGVEMLDGPLKGLLSRAVIVLDTNNNVFYTQQVSEITDEPDYNDVLSHLKTLIQVQAS